MREDFYIKFKNNIQKMISVPKCMCYGWFGYWSPINREKIIF